MRIKNLNDKSKIENLNAPPRADITVWKGSKKTKSGIGANLNNLLRIEATGYAKQIIQKSYQVKEVDGSLLVDSLNIVPAYEDLNKTLTSQMVLFKSGGKIMSICDRETIHTEFVDTPDKMGNHYRSPVAGSNPCPVAGTNHRCPNGCTLNGDFYFYILELLLAGSSLLCRLQTHSIQDNIYLAQVLDSVKAEIGSIKKSPFVSEETRSYVVYRFSRKEIPVSRPVIDKATKLRTENRFASTDWALSLELHPLWRNKYDRTLQLEQLQSVQVAPSNRLLADIYGESILGMKEIPALAPSNPDPYSVYRDKLATAYKRNKWTKDEFQELITSEFKKVKLDETWSGPEYEKLLEILSKC